MIGNFKFNTGDAVLTRYKQLQYKVPYALAEFIDNSLHAYLNDPKVKTHRDKCVVKITTIGNTKKDKVILINDNSGGIHPDDFSRLLEFGERKKNVMINFLNLGWV